MNTGQMLQTIGALGLLSLLILNANRAVLGNTRTVYTGQYAETALLIAQSYILDASMKYFDEVAINAAAIKDSTKFSSPLGPDAGESGLSSFDDFDDYNGYSGIERSPTRPTADTTAYRVYCTVEYVLSGDPSTVTSSKQFFKRITVSVTVPYADPTLFQAADATPRVRLSSIVSYH
jgi:hypothetical protein